MRSIRCVLAVVFFLYLVLPHVCAGSLDIPSSTWGISLGNSKQFNGLRLNYRDRDVEQINGVNLTLWKGYDPLESNIRGVSAGVLTSGGRLTGLNLGLLGVGATRELNGVSFGLLGGGAGGDVTGIALGGLGVGAGGSVRGIVLAGLGSGAGGDLHGLAFGLLGTGAGGSVTGISVGGLGTGAGGDVTGLVLGGLGAGAGGSLTGISVGGLGSGAGGNIKGVTLGGLGTGAGGSITGVAIAGLGVGAGGDILGATLALGTVKVAENSRHTGLTVSAVNWNEGHQTGLALGIVNFTRNLRGVQIGLVNIVQDKVGWSRALPLVNASF